MRPYTVHGKRYYPSVVHVGEIFYGRASWYGPSFHGKLTSNGETYNMHSMTAAHKTLPMNTIVRATNQTNNRSVIVRINDRGPFVESRIIDLSKKAAGELDMIKTGTAPIKLEILGFEQKGKTSISSIQKLQSGPKEQVLGAYAIQIGAFSKFEGAVITQEKNDNLQGYKAVIKDVQLNDKRIFRVFLTGFNSEEEAQDFIRESQFNHAIIIRE
jgi:rare lipoprotein A